jgi:hypothetical protein
MPDLFATHQAKPRGLAVAAELRPVVAASGADRRKVIMQVEVFPVVPPELRDEAWVFYRDTFDSLKTLAVQRHVLHRDEFDHLLTDPRMVKYLARRDGAAVGMSAMSADLAAVPLISPDYFAHRWPELYDQHRIFYCVFVGVHPGEPGKGVFVALQDEMYRHQVGPVDGVAVLDICTYNEEERKLPWVVEGILSKVAGAARAHRLDSQSFWLYEFSEAS